MNALFGNIKNKVSTFFSAEKRTQNFEEIIVNHSQDNEIEEEEKTLLLNVLSLKNVKVCDILTPRADIVFIQRDVTDEEFKDILKKTGFSRFPVVKETLDHVIGVLDVRDFIRINGTVGQLKKILKEPFFIAPSMRILDLMIEMRDRGIHMAMVVDEYGGIDGLVTLDDITEEIIGEIQDSEERLAQNQIIRISDNEFVLHGRVSIESFEAEVAKILLPEERKEDIHTIGGLLFYWTGRIPSKGEIIKHESGYEFEILDADTRRIKRVCVRFVS